MDTCSILCVYNGHVLYTLCLQWTLVLYSVVINDGIINPPISQVNSPWIHECLVNVCIQYIQCIGWLKIQLSDRRWNVKSTVNKQILPINLNNYVPASLKDNTISSWFCYLNYSNNNHNFLSIKYFKNRRHTIDIFIADNILQVPLLHWFLVHFHQC